MNERRAREAVKTLDLHQLNQEFETQSPQEIIAWAVSEFRGKLGMTSSFGPESGVLLHMVSRIDAEVPVLFLETGYHFPETIEYKNRLVELTGMKQVRELRADTAKKAKVVAEHDGVPYEKNPDLCCHINKVEPLDEALTGLSAWMSGIRRHQSDARKSVRIVEQYDNGLFKISPLCNFTSRDAWWYLKEHNIPLHPLYEKGYLSIGCWPCTRPVQAGDDERAGRWAGKAKTECGIHTFKEVLDKKDKAKELPKDVSENI